MGVLTENPQITFIQNHLPALESGQYRFDAQVAVAQTGNTFEQFYSRKFFYVQGKRNNLDAAEVNSVFPPLGSSGQYERVMPHVVLNSSTLPWQRSTGFSETLPSTNRVPWLALLLFDESENITAPQQVTLGTLNSNSTSFFPSRVNDPGESDEDVVNVIDVPITLFNQICPSAKDLQWLAHVRNVSVKKKSTSHDKPANDTYAVVISNRLPQAGRVSTMHLVALENYNAYLPVDNGSAPNTPSTNFPAGYSSVRLISLYSWSFRCTPQQQSFGGLLLNADMNPPTLQMPFANDSDSPAAANTTVQKAFGMGYTAMNHQLRNGDRTVSWYRGPLLPLGTPVFLNPPYTSADTLMRYDPTIGMLDASYASAWQLGKLLALQDAAYSQTLARWKAKQTGDTAQALEEAIIDEQFSVPQTEGGQSMKKQSRISFSIKNVVGPAAARINSASDTTV